MKDPPKLEGDAIDGAFANKHGRHVIGHVDDYSALQQQIGQGKLLVQKILSLARPACNIPGPEAQGTEVRTWHSWGLSLYSPSFHGLHRQPLASDLGLFIQNIFPVSHLHSATEQGDLML